MLLWEHALDKRLRVLWQVCLQDCGPVSSGGDQGLCKTMR